LSKKKSKNKPKANAQKINEKTEIKEADKTIKQSEETDEKKDNTKAEVKTGKNGDDTKEKQASRADNENIDSDVDKEETQPKPILPRKRKIVKNNQLIVVFCITLAAVLTASIWHMFFDRDITGCWYYNHTGGYTESEDISSKETTDLPEAHTFTQRVSYNFDDSGKCTVTLGSMSVTGPYQKYDIGAEQILAIGVYYQDTPLLTGNYHYKVSGNVFTGKKLTLFSDAGSASDIVLEQGEGDFSLSRFEDEKLDEKIYGRWKNSEYDQIFTFRDDGHMILELDNKIVIDHVYTIIDESTILAKYATDAEQSYSYHYEFDNEGNLLIDGVKMIKQD